MGSVPCGWHLQMGVVSLNPCYPKQRPNQQGFPWSWPERRFPGTDLVLLNWSLDGPSRVQCAKPSRSFCYSPKFENHCFRGCLGPEIPLLSFAITFSNWLLLEYRKAINFLM